MSSWGVAQTYNATYACTAWTNMSTGEEVNETVSIVFLDNSVTILLGSKKYVGSITSRTDGDKKIEFTAQLNGKATVIKILTFGNHTITIKNDELNALINCEKQ